jgi:hypothetical protein
MLGISFCPRYLWLRNAIIFTFSTCAIFGLHLASSIAPQRRELPWPTSPAARTCVGRHLPPQLASQNELARASSEPSRAAFSARLHNESSRVSSLSKRAGARRAEPSRAGSTSTPTPRQKLRHRGASVGGIRNQAFRIPKIKECLYPCKLLCERFNSETPGAIDSFSIFQNLLSDQYPSSPAELPNEFRITRVSGSRSG